MRERERTPPPLYILVNVSACLAGHLPSGWVTQPPLWMDVYSFIVYTPAAAKLLQTYSGNTGALVLAGSTVCEYESADRSGEKLYLVRKDSSLPAPRMCQPAGLSLALCEPGAEPDELPKSLPDHARIQRKAESRRGIGMQLRTPPTPEEFCP